MNKIRLTAVNYLNTKPFMYGLFLSGLDTEIEIHKDIPAACADKLIADEVDLALIPVAAVAKLKEHYIVSNYCIGCDGAVKTVCIYSNSPLTEVKRLYLDAHSRTSAAMTKILMKDYWRNETVAYHPIYEIGEEVIDDDTALLAIGDKTMGMEKKYRFTYDLGEAWKALTGLPFVFAAWVANKKLDPAFISRFNDALEQGLAHIPELMFILPEPEHDFDLQKYFEENISYELDEPKKEALRLFMSKLDQNSEDHAVQPVFV